MSGRPGPVWVDVPKDIQQATITLEALPLYFDLMHHTKGEQPHRGSLQLW